MRSFFLAIFAITALAAPSPSEPARLLVHLLDYLANDYGGAVREGTVISESEYKEQVEFADAAVEAGKNALSDAKANTARHQELSAKLAQLKKLIADKKSATDVAQAAHELQASFIQLTGLTRAPKQWPSLKRGSELFARNCASCHGVTGRGDGPAGAALEPKPANFMDSERMSGISPFQAFNTIRLGVPGTAMAPFALSESETWDLAFYVSSLRAAEASKNDSAIRPAPAAANLLEELATSSDQTWREKHKNEEANKLAALRLASGDSGPSGAGGGPGDGPGTGGGPGDGPGTGGGPGSGGGSSLDLARAELKQSLSEYEAGRAPEAKNHALVAYLSGVEPIEPRLKASSNELMLELEKRMMAVRSSIDARAEAPAVRASVEAALAQIEQADQVLRAGGLPSHLILLSVIAIFLREGFEAVLVLIAILGVVKAARIPRAERWIHGGWIAAVALGVVAWFGSGWLIQMSGASRELMEGFTALFAVLILLYMGFWLHSRAQIGKWKEFIDGLTRNKLDAALSGQKMLGLAGVSFIAVFREAFEVVLFLRALVLEGGETSGSSAVLGLGVALSFLLVLGLAWALLRYSARLPIGKLFKLSSWVMSAMAVVLTGKGLHSLQESGLLPVTSLRLLESWQPGSLAQFSGFYPTLETGVPQLLVLLGVLAMTWFERPKRELPPEEASI